MRLSSVAAGDLVLIDRKGREFLALVDAVAPRSLAITPLKGVGVTYRTAQARDVRAYYKRRGGQPARHVLVGQA